MDNREETVRPNASAQGRRMRGSRRLCYRFVGIGKKGEAVNIPTQLTDLEWFAA